MTVHPAYIGDRVVQNFGPWWAIQSSSYYQVARLKQYISPPGGEIWRTDFSTSFQHLMATPPLNRPMLGTSSQWDYHDKNWTKIYQIRTEPCSINEVIIYDLFEVVYYDLFYGTGLR